MLRVLAIDDDPAIPGLVRTALDGWRVDEAPDGEVALSLLERGLKPDLIVLDIVMNRFDGYDTCMRIRECNPDIPILPLTGACDKLTLDFLDEMSCAPPLIKPVSLQDIQSAAHMAIGTITPPVKPGYAVLAVSQRKATERLSTVRYEKVKQNKLVVFATNDLIMSGLSLFICRSGTYSLEEVTSISELGEVIKLQRPSWLVTANYDWSEALALGKQYGVPTIIVASTRADGLAVALQARGDSLGVIPMDERELRKALLCVASRQRYVPYHLFSPFVGSSLYPSEQNIVALAMAGLSPNEIALTLCISKNTLKQYINHIGRKTNTSGLGEIARWGRQWEREHGSL